jgi:undecaprenyl-phosphate galactose phosphotransferase
MKNRLPYKYFFGTVDFIILLFSFLFSLYILRSDLQVNFFEFFSDIPDIVLLLVIVTLFILVIFIYNGLYRLDVILHRSTHFIHLLKAIYYSSLQIVLMSLLIDSKMLLDARLLILFFFFFAVALLFIIRVELMRWLFIELSQSSFRKNVIIVGDGKAGKLLATKLMYENPIGLNILGFVDDGRHVGDFVVGGKKVLGNYDDLEEVTKNYPVDELLVAIDNESYERFFEIVDVCKSLDVPLRITSEVFSVVSNRMQTERYSDVPVIDVNPKYNDGLTLGLKRVSDIFLSCFALVLLSPFLTLIALIIKITSPGPVLFKQARIGQSGKAFMFYKFRSMKPLTGEDEDRKEMMINFMKNGDAGVNDTKIINENRVTWIGKIIRKTSLDELPQLFNVIKGDMSLVGPRPCLPYEFENYDEWQKRRVSVIPGCTGVWQVWGRSAVSFKESIVLDLYYINNMSPWLDMQLILQTIPVMLFSRGAR